MIEREVWEEAGSEVIPARPIAVYSVPRYCFTNAIGAEHQMFTLVFLVEVGTGEVLRETDETLEPASLTLTLSHHSLHYSRRPRKRLKPSKENTF